MNFLNLIRTLPGALLVISLLTACSSIETNHSPNKIEKKSNSRTIDQLISAGLSKLKEGLFTDASQLFNIGLKLAPEDARLHFLNGLSYHLQYLHGDQSKQDLARTGYKMALAADPGMYEAAFKLGHLELEAGQPQNAVSAFRRSLEINNEYGEAFLGLAAGHYYLGDVEDARKAANQAQRLLMNQPNLLRAATLIQAASGNDLIARESLSELKKSNENRRTIEYIEQRIGQWRAWHKNQASSMSTSRLNSKNDTTNLNTSSSLMPPPFTPTIATESNTTARHWADCGTTASTSTANTYGNGNSFSGGYGYTNSSFGGYGSSGTQAADESSPQAALPAPCSGTPPRMALIDVNIIRTEDNSSRQIGINLLSGLNYVLTNNFSRIDTLTRTGGLDTQNITVTRQQSGGINGTSGIAYSLNIANSTDSRSDILAQPSLVALDRQPSTFFSGRVLTVGMPASVGSVANFTDRPAGVSLSVTPTFIDDETLLIAVRATRSFFESTQIGGNFTQSMQTSRNAVSANLVIKFGETLILSGLKEEEVTRETDGVPLLQDVPALRHLFRRESGQRFNKSVLITLTPRQSNISSTQGKQAVSSWRLQARPQDINIDWSGDKQLFRYLTILENSLISH